MEDYHSLFLEQFRNYGFVSEAAEKDLLSRVSRVHRTKGHQIIREGQVATSFFIVESGMLHSFYQKGKSEITIWFAYEGQKAVSISSLFDNKPSRKTSMQKAIHRLATSLFSHIFVCDSLWNCSAT